MNTIAMQRFGLQVRRWIREKRGQTGQTYVWNRVDQYRQMWMACAKCLGATFVELEEDFWEIRLEQRRVRICNDILPFDDAVVLEMAGRKALVYELLSRHDLPVPDHLCFHLGNMTGVDRFLDQHPDGCVIKPANGTSSGQGVTTHITEAHELRTAAILASLFGKELIIEQMIPGECFRLLVLDGHTIHAVGRFGPRVMADGISNVEELIASDNDQRRSQGRHELIIDADCIFTLKYQNLALDSVPIADTSILIKSVDNPTNSTREVRTVYNTNVLQDVHPSILRQAEHAARIIGSRFVGVDLICRDCTQPLKITGGVINEVNTTPGLHHHYDRRREDYPVAGLMALCALLGIQYD